MKSDFIQYVAALVALVLAGACEELLPKPFGVGFPVLLACVQFGACRRPAAVALAFALAAGAFEDALSSLPAMASVGYFAAVTALARWARLPVGCSALTYPGYQLWLWVWTGGAFAEAWMRALVALPLGLVTAFAAWPFLRLLERKAALDE